MNLTTSVVKNTSAFHDLKEAWNNLLKHSQSNTIFLRWEWLYNWWLVYENPKRLLYIILAKENDRIVGIAPLCIETTFAGIAKEIKFLGSNRICSDYLDVILLEEQEEEILHSMLFCLQKNKHEWNRLNLTDIPENSSSVTIIQSYFKQEKVSLDSEYTVCPYINLEQEWDTIVHSFSPLVRNTLSRKLKKFSALPDSAFCKVAPADIEDFYSKFVVLNRKRMEIMKRDPPFNDRNFLNFHKTILRDLSRQGMASLYFLKTEDNFFAGIYMLSYNGKHHFYQSGFSPDWSWLSPGTLLFYFCIQDAYKHDGAEFDFLRGNEKYKYSWTTTQKKNLAIKLYNTRLSSTFFQIIEHNWTQTERIIKKLTHYIGK